MIKRNSYLIRTLTAFKLAISFKPLDISIVNCFSDIEAHVESTMICFSKSQTDLSFTLVHLRNADIGESFLEFIRI